MSTAILSPRPQSMVPQNIPFLGNGPAVVPSTTSVQRWDGNGRIATEWDSLRRDSELWLDHGECFVYLYRPGQSQRGPSFRIPYEMLVEAACNDLLDHHLISTWNSSPYSPSCPGGECYLYLHAPSEASREGAFQYHIDTRNFFAWIVGKPLVGADPISSLVRLKDRMDAWRDPSSDNTGDLIAYIKSQGYCDMSESMEAFKSEPAAPPTPRTKRGSIRRLLKIPTPSYGKRMSELFTGATPRVTRRASLVRPVSTIFSAIGGRADTIPSSKSEHDIDTLHSNDSMVRRGSCDSEYSQLSSLPPLVHSRDDSMSSSVSSAGSERSSSPSTPHTPNMPTSNMDFSLDITEGKEHRVSDDVGELHQDMPHERAIDDLIAELRRGDDD